MDNKQNGSSRPSGGNGNTNSAASVLDESTLPPFYSRTWLTVFEQHSNGSATVPLSVLKSILQTASVGDQTVEKIIGITTSPNDKSVSREVFLISLALLAFAQNGRPIDIQSVYSSRDALPLPKITIPQSTNNNVDHHPSTAPGLGLARPSGAGPPPTRKFSESSLSPGDPWNNSAISSTSPSSISEFEKPTPNTNTLHHHHHHQEERYLEDDGDNNLTHSASASAGGVGADFAGFGSGMFSSSTSSPDSPRFSPTIGVAAAAAARDAGGPAGDYYDFGNTVLNSSSYAFGNADDEDSIAASLGFDDVRAPGGGSIEAWNLPNREKVNVVRREELGGGTWGWGYTVWLVRFDKTGSNVERRYSDFVWLLECLTRRYPFRLLPLLPPKRVAISGHHLATDDQFLERRRKGLERFLTFVVNHPILKNDGIVRVFLGEENDLSLWRSSVPYNLDEESLSRSLSPREEAALPADLDQQLISIRQRIIPLVASWTAFASAVERLSRGRKNEADEWQRMGDGIESVLEREASEWRPAEVVAGVERDLGVWGAGVKEVGRRRDREAVDTELGFGEEAKRHRDLYVQCRDLFGRQHTLTPDAVDRLKRRVDGNIKKIQALRDARERKPTYDEECERFTSAIEADQRHIDLLLRRRVFIRYCMHQEILYFFRCTSLFSKALRGFVEHQREHESSLTTAWESLEGNLP